MLPVMVMVLSFVVESLRKNELVPCPSGCNAVNMTFAVTG